jgi:hypothetical protein
LGGGGAAVAIETAIEAKAAARTTSLRMRPKRCATHVG